MVFAIWKYEMTLKEVGIKMQGQIQVRRLKESIQRRTKSDEVPANAYTVV